MFNPNGNSFSSVALDEKAKATTHIPTRTIETLPIATMAHSAKMHDDVQIDGSSYVVDQINENAKSWSIDKCADGSMVVKVVTERFIHLHQGHT